MLLLKDQAYQSLLRMVQEGSLERGKIYSLKAISAQLEMSITPVRDAIQRLCDEGRMDILPSRGIRLHEMTKDELVQHYHFSSAIEGYCVYSLAAAYKNGNGRENVERLQFLLDEMASRLTPESPFQEYFHFDKSFHREILESLKDPYFSSLQHSAMGFYDHPELQHDNVIAREEVFQCHMKILNKIREGDPEGAYRAVIEHADLMMRNAHN